MRLRNPVKPRYIPVLGYAHFYRSLLLYTALPPNVAGRLVYELYIGNLDTCSEGNVPIRSAQLDLEAFGRLIFYTRARPYHTPVQLYRAMEHIFRNVQPRCVTGDCNRALETLHKLSDALAQRFEQAFGLDISDSRTCYNRCLSTLSSYSEERPSCFFGGGIGHIYAPLDFTTEGFLGLQYYRTDTGTGASS